MQIAGIKKLHALLKAGRIQHLQKPCSDQRLGK